MLVMLVGLISDVHSNAVALREVLSEFERLGVGVILSAGDVVGYNPYPEDTVNLFRRERIVSIMGNHDRAVVTGDTSGFNEIAREAVAWTSNAISEKSLEYLRGLAPSLEMRIDDLSIHINHGSPSDPDEYIYGFSEELIPPGCDLLLLGHTHVQSAAEFDSGSVVNPGSVGQPRDRDPRAAFATLDTDNRAVELGRIEYDVEKVMEDIFLSGLPEILGSRLLSGR
ncbi:Calcineurin-like phosphoesterase superfamily domain protein [Candidatus Methanoperedenaceae archaeon GB50]|nr:MAG: Calcineurin-like phosphoesterase superfamily domain protein [Candidatus Methanoperedenaceae archaeon GB50]CAD7772429.1 Calcineurin-like phosphoesterase superfamily domain protein [Candidatus Methanoperedenaceae archaeon GB50]